MQADAQPDRWRVHKRVLTLLFFGLVAVLIFRQARTVDWAAVATVLQTSSTPLLLGAAGLAAASHAVYSLYDLIGKRLTGHALPRAKVMAVGWISYAFNLNFGSLVGGVGFRYRLYSRLGLPVEVITKIFGLSLVTNWLGYLFVGGLLFSLHPLGVPESWKVGSQGLQWLGALAALLAVAYMAACAPGRWTAWTWRTHTLQVPTGRVAALQLALSSLNWMLIAGVVYLLLQRRIEYVDVLSVALIAAVAGVVTHVPAGLGVLEAVFVVLLSHRASQAELLAALLAYRALYYLAPLVLAVPLFLVIDRRARREGARPEPKGPPASGTAFAAADECPPRPPTPSLAPRGLTSP